MNLEVKNNVVVGGAGLIGSNKVDALLKEHVTGVIIYDNFVRSTHDNVENLVKEPHVRVFKVGDDICQTDIINEAFNRML
ncbi:MAG: hypothetical protein Q8K36_04980 [Alphaproteobacteria bacterium]|nr:hypothetical protein [Alphaproteobacteria bacterium]